jgi:hypothetical protein
MSMNNSQTGPLDITIEKGNTPNLRLFIFNNRRNFLDNGQKTPFSTVPQAISAGHILAGKLLANFPKGIKTVVPFVFTDTSGQKKDVIAAVSNEWDKDLRSQTIPSQTLSIKAASVTTLENMVAAYIRRDFTNSVFYNIPKDTRHIQSLPSEQIISLTNKFIDASLNTPREDSIFKLFRSHKGSIKATEWNPATATMHFNVSGTCSSACVGNKQSTQIKFEAEIVDEHPFIKECQYNWV